MIQNALCRLSSARPMIQRATSSPIVDRGGCVSAGAAAMWGAVSCGALSIQPTGLPHIFSMCRALSLSMLQKPPPARLLRFFHWLTCAALR
jgi:hypothetical protein